MSPQVTAVVAKAGQFGLIPAAILVDLLAVGTFTVSENVGAGVGALLATVGLIWAIIKWVDDRIATAVKNHHEKIALMLNAQDAAALATRELLLEKLAGVNKQLEQPGRRH